MLSYAPVGASARALRRGRFAGRAPDIRRRVHECALAARPAVGVRGVAHCAARGARDRRRIVLERALDARPRVGCADGAAVLVNRGWVPRDDVGKLGQPAGACTVHGVLKRGEAA